MRFVILAHVDDETALRVYAALRARHGTQQVKIVSSEELALAPYWAHRIENSSCSTTLYLSDGTELSSDRIGVVFNRLRYAAVPHFAHAAEADRSYAADETYALWLSWLASLPCTVVNRPTSRGLGSQNRSMTEWLLLAAKAGFPTRGYHFSSDSRQFPHRDYVPHHRLSPWETNGGVMFEQLTPPLVERGPTFYLEALHEQRYSLLLIGDEAIGDCAQEFVEAGRRLMTLVGCDLLQITLGPVAGAVADGSSASQKICAITDFPDTREPAAIAAIARLLEAKQRMVPDR